MSLDMVFSIVTLLVGVVGLVLVVSFRWFETVKSVLKDPRSRKQYIDDIENPVFLKQYHLVLGLWINRVDKIFGSNKPFAWNAFATCLLIAIFYSLGLFCFSWVIGGDGRIGNVEILPSGIYGVLRFLLILVFSLSFLGLFFATSTLGESVAARLTVFLKRKFQRDFTVLNTDFFFFSGAGIGITCLILGGQLWQVCVSFSLVLIALGYFGRIPAIQVLFVSGAVTSMAPAFSSDAMTDEHNVLKLFIFALPVLNGIWDWLSWAVSRMLAAELLSNLTMRRLLTYAFLDFILAVVALVGLVAFLVAWFEIWSWQELSLGWQAPFPLNDVLLNVKNQPLDSNNIWITFMLISTLAPTVFHGFAIVLGIAAKVVPKKVRIRVAHKFKGDLTDRDLATAAGYYVAVRMFAFFALVSIPILVVFLVGRTIDPVSELLYGWAIFIQLLF